MIKTESFFALFMVLYIPIAIAAGALFYLYGNPDYFVPALWGSGVSVFLIWMTVIITNRLMGSSRAGLLVLVFGGLIFRFMFVIGTGMVVKFLTDLHLVSFLLGLLSAYLVLQVIEIIYFQKRFGKRSSERT